MRIFTATAAPSPPGLACLSTQIFTATDIKITTNTCFPSSNNLPTLHLKSNSNFRRFSSIKASSSSSVPAAGVNTQAVEKPPTADESPDNQTPPAPSPSPAPEPLTSQYISEDWEMARNFLSRGLIYRAQVKGFNSGGLHVRFQHLKGFIPFSELSPSHSCKEPQKTLLEIARALRGSSLSVKVIRADEESKLLIFSEKEAVWSKLSPHINLGDIFEARVGYVADFGAFLNLRFPDGCYHLTGLLRAEEVSWDIVRDVRDILNKGDEVRVKIINIDRAKSRILLSLKQLEEDPLLETLDKVIPQNGSIGSDSSSTDNIEPIPGLETIIQELLQEDGINDLSITREGFEKRVVSQDLQLWLSNAPSIGDHFTLLARAGRQVQEIQLTTTLDQEGIKAALQRVLERVP